jgi:hypothetical protein
VRARRRRRYQGYLHGAGLFAVHHHPGACTMVRWAALIDETFCAKTSFQLACAGEMTNYGRFGAGIYTSATSSKVRMHTAAQSVGRPTESTDASGERLRSERRPSEHAGAPPQPGCPGRCGQNDAGRPEPDCASTRRRLSNRRGTQFRPSSGHPFMQASRSPEAFSTTTK